MTGTVNAMGEPCLTIEFAGKSWTAVIDTGFNGDLELPESMKAEVKA